MAYRQNAPSCEPLNEILKQINNVHSKTKVYRHQWQNQIFAEVVFASSPCFFQDLVHSYQRRCWQLNSSHDWSKMLTILVQQQTSARQ